MDPSREHVDRDRRNELEEARKVLHEMAGNGLARANDFEVYVMCEIPNNVVLAAEFAELFDGFSIGSNDLTQLTLGVDRDSELLAHLFDEQDPGVKALIAQVVRVAHEHGRKVGLCGQAPSERRAREMPPRAGRRRAATGIQ